MKKKILAILPALAVSFLGFSHAEVPSDYPSRNIEIIVPFGPGGSTDTSARLIANSLGKYLPNNPNVVVVNKPGGATTIAIMALVNADPDGYTLALTSNSPITIQPHFDTTTYSYDSFTPIIKLVNIPQVLLVKKDSPWTSFDEWLSYVKDNPSDFTYATPGNGSISDLAMAVLNEAANVSTRAIPYNSGGKAMAAMLGGNVGGVATFQGNADSSQTRALVNFSSERSTKYGDVPTLRDVGIEAEKNAYIGIIAPKGIDPEIADILHNALKQTLEDPSVQEALLNQSFDISYGNSETYADLIQADYNLNGALLRNAGLIN
jgi:tripartite-type tricarboxylate transporter receptor subunit TctC